MVHRLILFIHLFVFGCVWSSLLRGLSLSAPSGGYSLLGCMGFSLQWLLLLQSTGSRPVGSVVLAPRVWSTGSGVVVHRLCCSAFQWLRLHTSTAGSRVQSTAGGMGSIPGWGTKIPHALGTTPPPQKKVTCKNNNSRLSMRRGRQLYGEILI